MQPPPRKARPAPAPRPPRLPGPARSLGNATPPDAAARLGPGAVFPRAAAGALEHRPRGRRGAAVSPRGDRRQGQIVSRTGASATLRGFGPAPAGQPERASQGQECAGPGGGQVPRRLGECVGSAFQRGSPANDPRRPQDTLEQPWQEMGQEPRLGLALLETSCKLSQQRQRATEAHI